MKRIAAALALLAAVPLLVAARDPRGDVTVCGSGAATEATTPDLVAVDASAQELGTAAVWRLTFAEPLDVPDPAAAPLRIDILVRDPRLPAATVGTESGLNRIVRWDATSVDAPVVIKWITDHSQTPFNPPVIEGDTVELRVPGRILLGESANGSESVQRLRWSVLVRGGGRCDGLGGRPVFRLRDATASSPRAHAPSPSAETPRTGTGRGPAMIAGMIGLGLLMLWGLRRFAPR